MSIPALQDYERGQLMITVHYLEKSRAHRLVWLLEELELDYDIRSYKRDKNFAAPPELKSIHPLGKSPVVEIDGEVLAESGIIFEYLCDTKSGSWLLPPPGDPGRYAYLYWVHYAEGSAMPPLVDALIFSALPSRVPFFVRPFASIISKGMMQQRIGPEISTHIDFWEQTLSKTGCFAGDSFSVADLMMSFPVAAGMQRGSSGNTPAIAAWLSAIRTRPAYQIALEKGGAQIHTA